MKAPSPCEFRRAVVLPAVIGEVYAFHENPHNVGKISPAWQSVRVLRGESIAKPGDEFEISIRLFALVTMRWRGIWCVADRPAALIDEALDSPFAFWRHRHLFSAIDAASTSMTDHVSYQFPCGWLGKLFGETFGRLQFHLMFADRHKRTVRALAGTRLA